MAGNFFEAAVGLLLQQAGFNDPEKRVLIFLHQQAQESAADRIEELSKWCGEEGLLLGREIRRGAMVPVLAATRDPHLESRYRSAFTSRVKAAEDWRRLG